MYFSSCRVSIEKEQGQVIPMLDKKYDRLLWLLLIGIAAFNKADFMLTHIAISEGFQEFNPIINRFLDTWVFPFLKFVFVPTMLFIIWKVRRRLHKRALGYVWFTFGVYFMLMVYFRLLLFSNVFKAGNT